MRTLHYSLRFGDSLDLSRLPGDAFHVLHARGRGIQVDVPAGWMSLWWPLQGPLALSATSGHWTLPARHMQVWREGTLRCRALGPRGWLALCASVAAWDRMGQTREPATGLLPWRGRASRDAAGLLARIARDGHAGDARTPGDPATLLEALHSALGDLQIDLQACLARCNGRTLARRQQTLLRLLRVRHAIECNPDVRLDLDALSGMANYSPCHLIRIYRSVFGETPTEYAARLRERQAWDMVSGTGLPICEITGMLGFESQSAFCRAFKNAFGRTTSEVRRLRQEDADEVRQPAAA